MKKYALVILGVFLFACLHAQDTIKLDLSYYEKLLQTEKTDSGRADILRTISEIYRNQKPDTALLLAQQSLDLARSAGYQDGEMRALFTLGKINVTFGKYPEALELYLQSLNISERTRNMLFICILSNYIGEVYEINGDHANAWKYFQKAIMTAERNKIYKQEAAAFYNISRMYENTGDLDSAKWYGQKSFETWQKEKDPYKIAKILNTQGSIAFKLGETKKSLQYYRQSIGYAREVEDSLSICIAHLGLAKIFQKNNLPDSALFYGQQSLSLARASGFNKDVMNASGFLSEYFKMRSLFDSALVYRDIYESAKDSVISQDRIAGFQRISFENQLKQKEIEQTNIKYRNRNRSVILIGGLAVLLVIAFILWRNNRTKHKANQLLSAQKLEIDGQKKKIETSYADLQAAQTQLIHAEKMASLGELTAGIAHEIQNPLNFVKNFSEVTNELLDEMEQEINKGNYDEAKTISSDVKQNLEKIIHHSKRADVIVKGMLQHSRTSSSMKEPVAINELADEYLKLAYHGLRAKDKSFNSTMKTDYDQTIGLINIIPQDIGRVILNLITNAFYAVNEKMKQQPEASLPAGRGYEPTVSVSTKRINDKVEIKVKDNGNGIPQKALDKIFQPFFTTKPTGQGTGLGLSLSYDIVKAHGGEIKVNTVENEGTEFMISLPL